MTVTIRKSSLNQRVARLLSGIVCLVASSIACAQTADIAADTSPPEIELEELVDGVASASQVFTAQILEETKLDDVTLYYRRSGQEPYTAAPMSPLGQSGFYFVAVSTDPSDLRTIEYYVQARDAAGNRTVSGFAFDPYERALAPAPVGQTPPAAIDVPVPELSSLPPPEPFYKKRWVQVALGVVAVGILANSLSSDDGEDTRRVPLNITLD